MSALTTMAKTQTKVLLREPTAVFFGLVFPALLLLMIGLVFPGATEPSPDLSGRRLVDVYAPVTLALGLATVAISILPTTLGNDRERGVLRRLSTTPVHPRVLVVAHLTVQLLVAAFASIAALLVGALVLDVTLPQSPGWFVLSFLLAAAALLGLGLLIGAVVPTASAGQAAGMILYFPLLFFAGVWIPMEVMPQGVRVVSEYTPAGAGVQALSDAWVGSVPTTSNLLVMASYALATGLLATWMFRWE
jgi:ABC-2 type transport system permease protein